MSSTYWLADVWEEEAERVNFIGDAQLYRWRSVFEIHALQHEVRWEDMTCWHRKMKVSRQCIQGPKTQESSLQSPGRCSIVACSTSRPKKADRFTASASVVCSWGHFTALYMSVCVCVYVCVHICKHLRTFTCKYMWYFLSKALLKSCNGICGFRLPCSPHFGQFPWVTPLLVLISNGHWGLGSSNRRDSTEQTFVSELWHEWERRKACRISFLHFAFSCNYPCKSIFKHQMGEILQLFWFHTLTVFTC